MFEIAQTTFSVCFKARGSYKVASAQVVYSTDGGGINSGINKAREKIIGIMKADPSASTRQIAEALGIDARSAESHVRWLKKAGIVKREGAKKNGRWVVNASAAQKIYSADKSGINGGINGGINEARKKIVGLMKADPSTSTRQIAEALGIDARSAESHVRWLRKAGFVEREGAKKNGRWVVKKMV